MKVTLFLEQPYIRLVYVKQIGSVSIREPSVSWTLITHCSLLLEYDADFNLPEVIVENLLLCWTSNHFDFLTELSEN